MVVDFKGGKRQEITVDSGAEESVCPKEWGAKEFGTKTVGTTLAFRGASGAAIEHFGERGVWVTSPC